MHWFAEDAHRHHRTPADNITETMAEGNPSETRFYDLTGRPASPDQRGLLLRFTRRNGSVKTEKILNRSHNL